MAYMKGAEIIGESILQLGVEKVYGFPHPPVSELHEYLAKKEAFLPALSLREAASTSLGLSLAGKRTFIITSGTNIHDVQEAVSYAMSFEIPLSIIHVGRSLPGLGNPYPYQGDFDILTGGDFPPLVFSPASLEEIPLLLGKMVALAEKCRVPSVFYIDSALFHMTGDIDVKVMAEPRVWGFADKDVEYFTSVHLDVAVMEKKMFSLIEKFNKIQAEALCESYKMEDAEYAICAYGICGYIAKNLVDLLRASKKKTGLLRPVTLSPFVNLKEHMQGMKKIFVIEMSNGQLTGRMKQHLVNMEIIPYCTYGGLLPEQENLFKFIEESL
jgi:pyruvate/2-oxoacid:ferredoxin oxidoreductase alpha subunit